MSLSRRRLGGPGEVSGPGLRAMRRLTTIGVAIVILGLFPSTASAEPRWLGRAADPHDVPNDPNCGGSFGPCYGFDVRTVTLKIREADNGRAYLVITLRSFTPHGGFASGVALTRGAGHAPTIASISIRRDWRRRRLA